MLSKPVTPDDIAAARGAAFLENFAPADHGSGYDTPRLERAIAQATRKAAAWAEGVHRFPLTGEAEALMRGLIIDLALYEYGAQADVMTDDLRARHKDVLAFLKDVRMGRASLGGKPAATGRTGPTGGAVRVSLGRRHFADSAGGATTSRGV